MFKRIAGILFFLSFAVGLFAGGQADESSGSSSSGSTMQTAGDDLYAQLNAARREREELEKQLAQIQAENEKKQENLYSVQGQREKLERKRKTPAYFFAGNAILRAGADLDYYENLDFSEFNYDSIRYVPYITYYKSSILNVGIHAEAPVYDGDVQYVRARETLAYAVHGDILEGLSLRARNYNLFSAGETHRDVPLPVYLQPFDSSEFHGLFVPELRYGLKLDKFKVNVYYSYPAAYHPEFDGGHSGAIEPEVYGNSIRIYGSFIYNEKDFAWIITGEKLQRQGWNYRAGISFEELGKHNSSIYFDFLQDGAGAMEVGGGWRWEWGKYITFTGYVPYGNLRIWTDSEMYFTPSLGLEVHIQ
jgi:hypothetical protein